MPCASWRGWPTTWRKSAGRRPASPPIQRQGDAAQSDGLQGRHQQSVGQRFQGDGQVRLGRRRRAGLDARRQLCRRPAHPHRAGALGPHEARLFRSRRSAGTNTPARRSGGKNEFDKADLDATDKDGNPVIPENAHVRLAAAGEQRRRANPAPALFLQRRRQFHRRALAALAAGHGI